MSQLAFQPRTSPRLAGLPCRHLNGIDLPEAHSIRARALGLARLERDAAGAGLLIPRCRSVHTFGMRFELDVYFLDGCDAVIRACLSVPPGRILGCRRARSVLELVPGGCRGERPGPPAT